MEQADIDSSWLCQDEENYTITEPEFRGVMIMFNLTYIYLKYIFLITHILLFRCLIFVFFSMLNIYKFIYILFHIEIYFQSQTSSPENPFGKSNMDDFDFVDVEGDMEADIDRSSKKKDVLEEGKIV